MRVSVEKLPTSEAVLQVDLTWEELEKASEKAYRKLVQKADIPGFRRGKAPRSILERRLGKEYIYQEGLDELINETYRNAIKEHDLTPITKPELDAPIFEMGQPYHFSLKVPIITPVELGDYKSLHFDREEAEVTSEEVDRELESMRNRVATWQEVERPAALGDRVTVDLKLTVEDQTVSDLKDNPFELTHERAGLFTGMDEQVVGMQAGETKSFTVTLPTDYSNEKLAGKEANYTVTLYKVEVKELSEIDDALAERVSKGEYKNLEDLSKAVSDSILDSKKRRIRDELRNNVVKTVIEQSSFTIHPLLIKEEAEEMLHQFSHLLERQRMSVEQYLMMMRKSREEYLKELEPDAEQQIKRHLVLDEVVKQENIEVSPEEIEALFQAYTQAGQELPHTESQVRAMAVSYLREKAVSRLLELTTDPDAETESDAEAQSSANAEAAALEGEVIQGESTIETEEDTPPTVNETTANPVE